MSADNSSLFRIYQSLLPLINYIILSVDSVEVLKQPWHGDRPENIAWFKGMSAYLNLNKRFRFQLFV